MTTPLRLAIIGCGNISTAYGIHIAQYPELLQLIGAFDLEPERADAYCEQHGGRPFRTFEEVLEAEDVDAIVNLTVHHAHFDLNARALRAKKHVFSEKPMALTFEQAQELIALAKENNVRLGAAPITFMGEGVQTAARILAENKIGKLRLVYAEVNWGQIERWIPRPAPYYTVGPLLDVGVYAITALTFLLGPVRRVHGYSAILKKVRAGTDGNPFPVTAPDFTTGIMEFENGVVARLTTNYYVPTTHLPHLRGLEFHGDDGSFILSDYHNFDAKCRIAPYPAPPVPQKPYNIELLREPKLTLDRALGLVDMAEAIREGRPHLGSAEHAAHVIEIMEGLQRSSDEGGKIDICSSLDRPDILGWAKATPLEIPEPEPMD